jgi:DNA recombination protein RmuC
MTQTLLAIGLAVAVVLLVVAVLAWRRAERLAVEQKLAAKTETDARLADLIRAQGEITGHVRGLTERIDQFGHRVGQSMQDTTRSTHESLSKLGERLAVIDKAQQTIATLSGQVVELQHVLANKQTRGAFGQGRMEAIVRDGLPANAYAFQHTLTNGTRPDCVIFFPTGPCLVIDAKFPLEAWNGIRSAATPEAAKLAEAQFRRDTTKHIQDIADRYFVPGETQDTAFMFVPSESIFADIHEKFEDVIQKAHRARIVIVSPSLLMLSIQVVTSLLRDQRMREQAHLIQEEVGRMMEDVGRLDERVKRLQTHFAQSSKDIDEILVSTRRVTARGARIEQVELSGGEAAIANGDDGPKKIGQRPSPAKPAQREVPPPPELPW